MLYREYLNPAEGWGVSAEKVRLLATKIEVAIGSGGGDPRKGEPGASESDALARSAPGATPNHIQCTECGTDLYLDSFTGDATIPAEEDPGVSMAEENAAFQKGRADKCAVARAGDVRWLLNEIAEFACEGPDGVPDVCQRRTVLDAWKRREALTAERGGEG